MFQTGYRSHNTRCRSVQAEPEIVKDEFIEWLGLLGGQRLNGIELVRQLNFDNNCSFWWLMATSQADNIGKSVG